MKIAFVVPHMIAGGMETYLFRLGRYLQKAGHQIVIVTTERPGEWWQKCQSLGFECKAVLLRNSFNRITHLSRVRRELANYDVLLMNDARYAKAALPGLPARIVAISVIHNDVPDAYSIATSYSDLQDAAIGISPRTFENIASKTGTDNAELILHGVELPPEPAVRESVLESGCPVKLLFCGRALQHHKNIFLLPKICSLLRDRGVAFSLDVVGDGSDLEELKNRFQAARLSSFVTYCGTLPFEKIYSKYLASHILLMPSFFEGFPLVPLEAQACGCVPVITRLPGITDVSVADGETGLLAETNDATSFADAVLALACNPPKWQAMSRAGIERVRTQFSIEKMGERYCELIERMCSKRSMLTGVRPKRDRWNPTLIGWTAFLPNALCGKLRIIEL